MRAILTGYSGFLGQYLLKALENQGWEVITVGRSSESLVACDLSTTIPDFTGMEADMVIHAAGLAHIVPKSEAQKQAFMDQNIKATQNLLDGLSSLETKPKTIVFISSVAVYGLETGEMISEETVPQPTSPYGISKYEAEKRIQQWSVEHTCTGISLRLPLILGENAPGNLGAMERAIRKGYYFRLGSGKARRSMVEASKLAEFIPSLLGKSGIYNLTDGIHRSYAEMDQMLAEKYHQKIKVIPPWIGKLAARIGDFIPGFPLNSYRLQKLEQSFTVSDAKAQQDLNWRQ